MIFNNLLGKKRGQVKNTTDDGKDVSNDDGTTGQDSEEVSESDDSSDESHHKKNAVDDNEDSDSSENPESDSDSDEVQFNANAYSRTGSSNSKEKFSIEQEDNRDSSSKVQAYAHLATDPFYARFFRVHGRTTAAFRDMAILSDTWTLVPDNAFASDFLGNIEYRDENELPHNSKLCETCAGLRVLALNFNHTTTTLEIAKNAKSCQLCGMLHRLLGTAPQGKLDITKNGTYLEIRGQRILRLSVAPQAAATHDGVQVAFPTLFKQRSSKYFELLRAWIRNCNNGHRDCCHRSDMALPTRVLDVGSREDSNSLCLYRTKPNQTGKYITLSHRWGDPKAHPTFCTYHCNVNSFLSGIAFDELPKTFQDAVTVTRALGIRYLWIDSLCIIQSHQGCSDACGRSNDWVTEAPAMGKYYSSSYLTIAATSAQGSSYGFLGPRPDMPYVALMDQGSSGPHQHPLYICEAIDDFHSHVDLAELNHRGWVFQERALSRRTIHFAAKQTYWECGGDNSGSGGEVRCETLAQMQNPNSSLLSDPLFPESVMERSDSNQVRLFEILFERYATLALTVSSDRAIAIAGLTQRLASAFACKETYGVFSKFPERCLLWRRGMKPARGMRRISKLSAEGSRGKGVPSWSWMAYEGEISYWKIPFGSVEWSDTVHFPSAGHVLKVLARRFVRAEGELVFDKQDRSHSQKLRCVIVGRTTENEVQKKHCYVLVIAPVSSGGPKGKYERVGVGYIPKRCVSDQAFEVKVV
ncbi:hypothetical protein E0Z10_g2075 [Xylaria hypoxylon]|uniref:Heterokaryon incompatibility domain-containing protein n=1 Tax=Xylaria hypoxylon TaxID=37992 RepID=A0A4Z0ZB46_9PEZI|nr:hypothetical protein E0Z10_g2075 [Xylaria hypoxylon]